MQTVEEQLLSRIFGHGRGWAFSPTDFLHLGSRKAVDMALIRLTNTGTIRRVILGIYDYPRYSDLLSEKLGPDIHQVATALARKFGWQIQPGGAAALNLIGLSTQIPAHYIYLSNGPTREYKIENTLLKFKKTVLKDSNFKLPETAVVVQAIKALGKSEMTPNVHSRIREWLGSAKLPKVLKDAERVTDWVYAEVKEICREQNNE